MKNFLEITVIKPKLQLEFTYKPHGNFKHIVTVNGHVCTPGKNEFSIDLLESIHIESTIFKKLNKSDAIEIVQAKVNEYTFLPLYMHLATNTNCWHDYEGKWQYKINKPFYNWFHEVSGQGWIA